MVLEPDTGRCVSEDVKGVDCEIRHRLERGMRGMSANEDAGLLRRVDCEIPYWLERGTGKEIFFIRVWKPVSCRCALKTLSGSPKRTISVAAGLSCYKLYSSQTPGFVSTRMLGPERGWIARSRINWRGEQVPMRTLGPKVG